MAISKSSKIKESGYLRPPFGYYGAKARLASRIVKLLPPHNAWVELFCGSAAVTLSKPRAPIEIINDSDRQIVNVFQQIRDHPRKLCRLVALTPYAREEFKDARNGHSTLNGIEGARRFLIASMMTVNGTSGSRHSGFSFTDSYTRDGKEARVSRWYHLPERIAGVVERLRSVRVESKDALSLFGEYVNRPGTLVYLDPPYLTDRVHDYKVDARDEKFHKRLLQLVKRARCMVLISGYRHDLYTDALSKAEGWEKLSLKVKTRSTSGKDVSRTEILWMNKAFQVARKKATPLMLSKKEKLEKKVNPTRGKRRKRSVRTRRRNGKARKKSG